MKKKMRLLLSLICFSLLLVSTKTVQASILDSLKNATEVEYDTMYDGVLSGGEDSVYYKFATKDESCSYVLSISNVDGTWVNGYILDVNASQKQVANVYTGKTESSELTLEKSSVYYIKLAGKGNYVFTLIAVTDVPDDSANAKPIKVDTLYEESLASADDKDWYKIKTPKYPYDYELVVSTHGGYWLNPVVYDKDLKEVARVSSLINTKTEIKTLTLKPNTVYYVYMTGTGKSPYSFSLNTKELDAIPDTLKIKSAKSEKDDIAVIKWNKLSYATGYQVRYSTASDMKDAKIVKVKKNIATIKRLTADSIYYIQVRAYTKYPSDEVIYSKWSANKSVKIK